jgi:glycosyltransferase involved in cell wall biosynthesis
VKVLVLTTSYPTDDDPVSGVFVREHVEAVRPHCDVEVMHLQRTDVRRIEVERDAEVWHVRYPSRPMAPWLLAAGARGLRLVRGHDVVHAHFFLAGLPAVLFQRRPVVVSEHWSVFLPEDPMQLGAGGRFAARVAFGRAALVLPVSLALQRGIEAHEIRARFRVVPNAVDTTLFHPGDDEREGVLAVGLQYEAKGIDVLLDALARLSDERLTLVGDGPLRQALEAQAAQLGISERVHFRGMLSKPEVAELMRRARVVAIPSRFETSAVVAIEALASGAPVVASRVGALPELLADGGGALVPANDPHALASALAAGPPALDGVAERIRARYSREQVGAELVEIYRSVASPRWRASRE